MLHVVDFDGAHDHSHENFKVVEQMCSSVVIPVEFAGGIRNLDDAKLIMDTGIARLALGTMAISNPEEFKKVFELFGPEKIVLSLDIIDDELIIKGRRIKTGINYKDYVIKMSDMGVERFIVTDVLRNGVLGGPNIQLCSEVAKISKKKVTISGGVRNKDELMDIQNLMPLGIDSVIVGRALYENKFPCQKLWRVAEIGIFN